MKKFLGAVLAVSLALVAAGCSSGVKDGTYTAKTDKADEMGYTTQLDVTVTGGKISNVAIESFTADGVKKSDQSKSGAYDMVQGGAHWQWHEQIAALEKYLVDHQGAAGIKLDDDGKTDAISGCSISVKDYLTLFNQAYAQAKK